MSGSELKPTPASGMPAAVAMKSHAPPPVDDEEIRAPKSVEASAILTALGEMRAEIQETRRESNARFTHLENRVADIAGKTEHNTKLIGEQAEALTRVASAAAKAADLALEAKQQVAKSPDETTKLVESAIRIHSSAIAATVDAAVQKAVQPLSAKVGALEVQDVQRESMLKQSNEALGAVVDELGLEDRVELGRTVPPGEKPPERALKKIERRAKNSTLVQLVIAIGIIVSALLQQFSSHH